MGTVENIKIIKKANQKSLIDFQSNLDYWKENNKGELVYKGGIRVSITEMGTKKVYLQSNIPKNRIKDWMRQILDGHVSKQWAKQGEVYSVENFGQRTNDGNLYSVKTSLEFKMYNGKPQFTFSITQGPGKKTATGAVTMITSDRSKIVTARKMLGMEEMNEIAIELSSFISNAEIKAMLSGKPYNDIMPGQESKNSFSTPNHSNNADEMQQLKTDLLFAQKQKEKLEDEKKEMEEKIKKYENLTLMARPEFVGLFRRVNTEVDRRKASKEAK